MTVNLEIWYSQSLGQGGYFVLVGFVTQNSSIVTSGGKPLGILGIWTLVSLEHGRRVGRIGETILA